jgi:diguanylate cyclase (GGDEF)-like protein
MRQTSRATRWRFSAGLLLVAVIALIATLALVIAFLFWASAGVDGRSLQRQTQLVEHVIQRELERIPHDQEGVAIWDDAIVNSKLSFDLPWVDLNLGNWMYEYFGHDRTFTLDGSNRPVYAMSEGVIAPSETYEGVRPVIEGYVRQLRDMIAAGALDAYDEGTGPYPHVVDVATVEGIPAIVSLVPITSDTGDILQDRGTEYLHVSIVEFDPDYAQRLAEEFLIDGAAFAVLEPSSADTASHPIVSSAGRVVAFFDWTPSRPGQQLVSQAVPVVAAAFAMALGLVLLLIHRLYRSSQALEAGRASAAHQAAHDTLTGLANRTQFEEGLTSALRQERVLGEDLALMILDLDRFKQVNDTLGHAAGDELIRAVGQRLREIVDRNDLLARLGGDEFAIVHTARSGVRGVQGLAHRIIDALGKPFEVGGREAFVGVSLGLVMADADDHDPKELSRKADIALYEAKANGRNRAIVYKDEMNELVQNRHTIESELRKALTRTDELSVVFQPLFSRESGKIVGAEALARWHHPRLGQVSPAHFIPVAEASGLIEGVGDLVLRRSAELGARWPGMRIAVNLSPTQLQNPSFSARLFTLLKETGMQARDLELEITEGVLIEDDHSIAVALHNLRANGVRIALDDFGTGYSSLNYLKRYPVDCIKVDRSFVSQLSQGSVSVAIVQAMITLAHALNIEVTAEGVETEEQMTILIEMGCNTFQGFLLSTPVTPVMIEGMFRSHGQRGHAARLATARAEVA